MSADERLEVRPAKWPRDLPVALRLFAEYFLSLSTDPAVPAIIREKDRAPELQALGGRYDNTTASLLLAYSGGRVLGCAAVQRLTSREHAAEMKRLYVRPEARGRGVGGALIQGCADWAHQHGARELLLDTLPDVMPGAVRLYRSLGFEPTGRYNENEGLCFAFFRLPLE